MRIDIRHGRARLQRDSAGPLAIEFQHVLGLRAAQEPSGESGLYLSVACGGPGGNVLQERLDICPHNPALASREPDKKRLIHSIQCGIIFMYPRFPERHHVTLSPFGLGNKRRSNLRLVLPQDTMLEKKIET